MSRFAHVLAVVALVVVGIPGMAAGAEDARPLLLHVKTALSIDDAQICVFPNLAWAALAAERPVTIVFDGSAVTSVTKGYGWRGWLGLDSTAMDRANLPDRERKSLAEQFGVPVDTVPHTYGEYLHFIKERGARIYYNATMAVSYGVNRQRIDDALTPLELGDLLQALGTDGDYLVY